MGAVRADARTRRAGSRELHARRPDQAGADDAATTDGSTATTAEPGGASATVSIPTGEELREPDPRWRRQRRGSGSRGRSPAVGVAAPAARRARRGARVRPSLDHRRAARPTSAAPQPAQGRHDAVGPGARRVGGGRRGVLDRGHPAEGSRDLPGVRPAAPRPRHLCHVPRCEPWPTTRQQRSSRATRCPKTSPSEPRPPSTEIETALSGSTPVARKVLGKFDPRPLRRPAAKRKVQEAEHPVRV